MRSQCLFAASLPLSTSTLVCVVLLANRLSLVLPYFLFYHTLLLPADISRSWRQRREIHLPIEIKVAPPGITISQGRTFMVTDQQGEINPRGDEGVYAIDT